MTGISINRVLVTGANGVLGSAVVSELLRGGVNVCGLGRHAKPEGFPAEWRQCDLLELSSVENVLQGVATVVHCATAPFAPRKDRRTLQNLMTATCSKPFHLVYVSVAGVEKAANASAYYRTKLEGEAVIQASSISHTILRLTQFHPLVDMLLRRLSVGPLLFRPSFELQPIDVPFAAKELVRHVMARSYGHVQDLCGPERLDEKELVCAWLAGRKTRKVVIPLPAIGPFKALKQIDKVQGTSGGQTWSEWILRNGGSANPYFH